MHKKSAYILLFLYFLSRLINLGTMPPFNDESIYLEWGMQSINHLKLFLSLADGKTPFSIWIFGIFGLLSPFPLAAARLGSVIAGFLSLFGIIKISKIYKLGNVPALLYIFAPAFLFFDRQALAESMLVCCFVWIIYFTHKLIKTQNLRDPIALASVYALSIYIKTNAVILIFTSLLIILINKKQKDLKNKLTVTLCAFTVLMLPLVIQQNFIAIIKLNSRFSLTIFELLKFPLSIWQNNLISVFDILITQTIGLGILALLKPQKKYINLYLWLTIPLLAYALLTRNTSVRYFTPIALSSIFIAATSKKIRYLILFSIAIFVSIDTLLIFNPKSYFYYLNKISQFSQAGEYTTGFSSGFEAKQAINYLQELSKTQKKLIITRADYGNPESTVAYHFYKSDNFAIYKTAAKLSSQQIKNFRQNFDQVYFVSREENLNGNNEYFKLEKSFKNEKNDYFVGIYKLDFDI